MHLRLFTYIRVIEGISRHNNLKKPVQVYDIMVDNESIQIGEYYFKHIDLELELRTATKAYMSGFMYETYVDILDKYYANNR